MIPAGTTLEFVATGHVSSWSPIEAPASAIESRVVNALMPFLTVKRVNVVPTTFALGGLLEYDYTASVAVATKVAHARPEDVTGWIVDALYRATNQTPQVLLASDPYAPKVPDDDPLGWLKRLGEGVQSTVTIVALGAIVLAVAILKK